jgi:molybdopterin synthase catalytic subunit
MVIQVFRQIAADIRTSWINVNRVVIHHRMGACRLGKSAF